MKKLFLISLLFGFILSFSFLRAEARDVKFAVLSDVHISTSKASNVGNSRNLTESIHYLQQAIKQINDSDVDFVIFSGDSVDKCDKYSIVMFSKIINSLKKPYYVGLGNHDVAQVTGVDKKEFYHLVNMFSHNKIKKLPYVKRSSNNLVFIFMDGVNEFIPGAKGFFKEKELLWLDKKLKKYKNNKVVIVQHFPLVEPYYKASHEIYNKGEYLKLLEEHNNVILVISGHYHADSETNMFNMRHISVPALVNSGEYYRIEIEKNKTDKYIIKTKILDVK